MNVEPLKLKPPPRQPLASAEAPANDLERRRELGQFFTSPDVAGFIWDLLEVIQGKRLPAKMRLIDPACGEGVFLRVAHIRRGLPAKSLFGADIDETLAPGWGQDPLLREANVVVANGLLDDPASGIEAGAFDIVAGNPPFSGKGLRDLLRLLEEPPAGVRHREQGLFGASYLKEEATPARRDQHAPLHSTLNPRPSTFSRDPQRRQKPDRQPARIDGGGSKLSAGQLPGFGRQTRLVQGIGLVAESKCKED